MRDIVATIQAEQDEIIRLDHPEVLVIEDARGTGRTVVGAAPRHSVRSS
jgi:DNA helicase IV